MEIMELLEELDGHGIILTDPELVEEALENMPVMRIEIEYDEDE